jgi:hypothetical protein
MLRDWTGDWVGTFMGKSIEISSIWTHQFRDRDHSLFDRP